MHFSASTIAALVTFALSTSACYSGGEQWGAEQKAAEKAVRDQCDAWKGLKFSDGENKYGCHNIGGGKRVNLRMRNGGGDGGPSRVLNLDTCLSRLLSQLFNCNYGGEDNQGAWRPRADPNSGNC